jgi:hypothetical protein
MGMLNLKNKVVILLCFMFFNCNNNTHYDKNYLLTEELESNFKTLKRKLF